MKNNHCLKITCAVFFAVIMQTAAAKVRYVNLETDTRTYNVLEDDCVRSDKQSSIPQKMLVYNNGTLTIDTYLKFDLSEFESVSGATLDLTIGGYSATGRTAVWQISLAENNWNEGNINFDNRPASLGVTLASTGPNIGGITENVSRWMESSMINIPISIPLSALNLQQRLSIGKPVITLRISSLAVTSGGEIDIASKETDGSFGNPGFERYDLAGKGAKLTVEGTLATSLATLSNLTVNGKTIAGFAPSNTEYHIVLPKETTDYPVIVAAPTESSATISSITYNPVVFNRNGENTATFTVTNGSNMATYQLIFTVDQMDDLCNLYMERVREDNMNSINIANLDGAVDAALAVWQSTGRFSDIDYTDRNGRDKDWESLQHVTRMRDFAFAYTMENSKYYENTDLYNKLVASLSSWVNNHPASCENWWFNWIPEPQNLGLLLIQMRLGKNKIDPSLENKVTDYMRVNGGTPGVSPAYSGANRMDVAIHWFYRACLTEDKTVLQTAMQQYYIDFEYVGVGTEGLQVDGSFFQHGQQFYVGGYGDVFISGALLLGVYTAGTQYALNKEQTDLLSKFTREVYFGTVRGQTQSWSVGGRGFLSRPDAIRKGPLYAQKSILIDPENTDEYEQIIARTTGLQPPSYAVSARNKHFYIGDYTMHIRPKYMFDVRMASTRTIRIEYGNYENLRTFFASDGCTNIMRTGKEYENIFPTWNWARIPGITCPQVPNEKIPLSASDASQPGISTFAGGVSDSLYAVTAYSYTGAHTGNSAKKSWFFFNDEVVCLGSDITSVIPSNSYVRQDDYDGRYFNSANWMTSTDQYEINTTVNQCYLKGDVTVSVNGSVSSLTSKGDHTYPSTPDWVLHDSIGYFFPSGGEVSISNKTQSGSWYDINRSYSNELINNDVFTLWLNHGTSAKQATYAYIVVPGMNTVAEMNAYEQTSAIEIFANTDSVQAVCHKELGIYGIVFYKAATFEGGGITVKASRSCVILLEPESENTYKMYIADPSHNAATVTIQTRIPTTETAWQTVSCTGLSSGASKVYQIQATPTGINVPEQNDPVVNVSYYDLMGRKIENPSVSGIYILKKTHLSKKVTTTKKFVLIGK